VFIKIVTKCLVTLYFDKLLLKFSNIYEIVMQAIRTKIKMDTHPIIFRNVSLSDAEIESY
jgi:hypothetical protein